MVEKGLQNEVQISCNILLNQGIVLPLILPFAQLAVKFEVSIPRGPNGEMVGEFCVICQNGGILNILGGYRDFWYIVNSANGADFTTFIS